METIETIHQIEKQIGHKHVGLRRILNHRAWHDQAKIKQLVQQEHESHKYQENIDLFLRITQKVFGQDPEFQELVQLYGDELGVCLLLERHHYMKLPLMIHYMSQDLKSATCRQKLRHLLNSEVFG